MNNIKLINSIDEITECDVKYAHVSNPQKWIQIDNDAEKEFCVYGMICGDLPTTMTTDNNWNTVKVWKTFNGVIKSLKRYSETGAWGMKHWK